MILIMGVAGAGKSAQGQILAEKIDYKWLSTGELLRKYISGDKKKDMLEGKLLDDQDLIGIIQKSLKLNDPKKIILDGFPRTKTQAEWLLERHKNDEANIEKIILIEVPRASVIERLLERGRPDDNIEAINKRFDEYSKMTLPIVDMYSQNGIEVNKIDGDKPIDEVTQDIVRTFKQENDEN